MQPISSRELSKDEAAVLAALLAQAPLGEPCPASRSNLSTLRVVGHCECGCDSLFFAGIESSTQQYRIADGLGYTTDEEEIGLILWAAGDSPVHLELYNYAEWPARLPLAHTVCPFEEARRTKT